jgi:peptide deformylase
MESIEECACLAANQIGVTKAIGVYVDEKREPHAIFNPRIMMGLGAQKVFEECMTRDEPSKVTRYAKVKLSYDELVDGELKARKRDFTGWVAQMIQHMCDHCQGKLV